MRVFMALLTMLGDWEYGRIANSVVIPAIRQNGVAIQRLRHETYVAGSTDNHELQREKQPSRGHRLLASRQAKNLLRPL